MSLFFLAHVLFLIWVSYRILHRKLAVSTTLAWLMLVIGLPFIGVALYFLIGDHKLGRRRLDHGQSIREYFSKELDVDEHAISGTSLFSSSFFSGLSTAIAKETGFHPTGGNDIELLTETDQILDSILEDIQAAKSYILFEFYIIDPQGRALKILDALEQAAQSGVDVRVLADDYGSKAFFRSDWPERLRTAGASVSRSLPVGFIKSLVSRSDLRNHRKIIVIDGEVGYIGSFNIVDPKKFKTDKGVGEWVDIMTRLRGPVIRAIAAVAYTDLLFDDPDTEFRLAAAKDEDLDDAPAKPTGHVDIQIIPSGPEMLTSVIYETLLSAIFGARTNLDICTPYFVPDDTFVFALCSAARRGVKVTLIVPEQLDSILARYASRAHFEQLLKAGVHVHLYKGGLLHTKAMLVDGHISFIGTVNLDMRSFYLNLELTAAVYDTDFTSMMEEKLNQYLDSSEPVEQSRWENRGVFLQIKENVLRLASPIL